jgi:hypothetical protein
MDMSLQPSKNGDRKQVQLVLSSSTTSHKVRPKLGISHMNVGEQQYCTCWGGTKKLLVKGTKKIAVNFLTKDNILGRKTQDFHPWIQECNQIPRIYYATALLVLNDDHLLAKWYLQRAH